MYLTIQIISILLLIPGIVMAFIPAIPNLVYMFIIVLIFGIYDNFVNLTPNNILVLAVIALTAMFIDFISGIIGAKWGGAHWSSIISGFIGLIIGSFLIPIPILGSLIGMFLGIFSSEFYINKDIKKANKAAMGSFWGTIAGIGIRIIASFVFFILFIIFIFNKSNLPINNLNLQNPKSIDSNISVDNSIISLKNVNILIASTTESKVLGLGDRLSLPDNTAMLFIFDNPDKYGIWMKNMNFSIDIFWLDENYKIISISENISPYTYPNVFYPVGNSSFILEANAGFAKKNNLQVGNILNLSLK